MRAAAQRKELEREEPWIGAADPWLFPFKNASGTTGADGHGYEI
jgi:hypothetical protein